jgi:hypothetical protein
VLIKTVALTADGEIYSKKIQRGPLKPGSNYDKPYDLNLPINYPMDSKRDFL